MKTLIKQFVTDEPVSEWTEEYWLSKQLVATKKNSSKFAGFSRATFQ